MGPVINRAAYEDYQSFTAELKAAGKILTGGEVITEGEYARGYFASRPSLSRFPWSTGCGA